MSETYVVHGAILTCSAGSQDAYLNPRKRGTTIGTGENAIASDSLPSHILGHFGTCNNLSGENRVCTKNLSGRWWDNTSRTAYYNTITSMSHYYRELIPLYFDLCNQANIVTSELPNINDNPILTSKDILTQNNAPAQSEISKFRKAVDEMSADLNTIEFTDTELSRRLDKAKELVEYINLLINDYETEYRESYHHGSVGKTPLLTSESKLYCSNDGFIEIKKEGQVLYFDTSAYKSKTLELRRLVREAITAHYAGQDNTDEQAKRTIERLNMNDDAGANKNYNGIWRSFDPESNPYKLIAWLVLLENNETVKAELLKTYETQASTGDLESVFIFEEDALQFEPESFKSTYISAIKADAYKLYPEIPLMNLEYSANYGEYEPMYSDHTGVDFIGGAEIYATHSGIVKDIVTGLGKTTSPSYGNHFKINNANNTFMYCHLENSDNGVLVLNNDFVLVGKKIGTKGELSGFGTGPHLHYEVRPLYGAYHSDVDPYNHLPASIRSKERFIYG